MHGPALSSAFRKAGEYRLADAELTKILILEPDNIPARMILRSGRDRKTAD